jgi:hypothetical protein
MVNAAGYQWQLGRTLVDKRQRRVEDYGGLECFNQVNIQPEWGLIPAGDRLGLQNSREEVSTRPLETHPGLFRIFAELDPNNKDDILNFANRHGLLGQSERLFTDPPPGEILDRVPEEYRGELLEYLTGTRLKNDVRYLTTYRKQIFDLAHSRSSPVRISEVVSVTEFVLGWAETHDTWERAIRKLEATVRLWDLVCRRDLVGLDDLLKCSYVDHAEGNKSSRRWSWYLSESLNPPRRCSTQANLEGMASSEEVKERCSANAFQVLPDELFPWISSHFFEIPRPEDAFEVARKYVQKNVAGELHGRVHTELVVEPGTNDLVLKMQPEDLRAAMWLQFAQAIAGKKQYRQCRVCAKWFEVLTDDDGRSARRLFCSDPCKSRDYRRRKERAVALRADGLLPDAIASRLAAEGLETDTDTVRKWVEKKGK